MEAKTKAKMNHLTPLKAIKEYCKKMCCNKDQTSWRECSITNCKLWPFRFGHRKLHKGKDMAKNKHKTAYFEAKTGIPELLSESDRSKRK